MPAPPSRSSLFPTGALLPATFKTLLAQWFDYMLPLLGNTGNASDARAALGAAADADVVKVTGAQTVAGVKTFSDRPIIPDATAPQNPVSKAQLDAAVAALVAADAATLDVASGANLSWQDMTASRAFATTYTNSTDHLITIKVSTGGASASTVTLSVSIDGGTAFRFASSAIPSGNAVVDGSFSVPPGATYNVTQTGGATILNWMELR